MMVAISSLLGPMRAGMLRIMISIFPGRLMEASLLAPEFELMMVVRPMQLNLT